MKNKKLKFLLLLFIITVGFVIYCIRIKDVEEICIKKSGDTQYYLINYALRRDFKDLIINHAKSINFKGDEKTVVYLKNNLLNVPDPPFDDEYDYKENGCSDIDNMDIYGTVNFTRLENGKMRVFYNLYDENESWTEVYNE